MALRDQFVCGLKDHETKVELFKKSSLTFEDAYKEATSRESAEKNATSSLSTSKSSSSKKEEVFAISNAGRKPWHKQRSENTQSSGNMQQGKRKIICYCCAKPNHTAKECRFKDYTCHNYKKKGHLKQTCQSKEVSSGQKQQRVQLIQRQGDREAADDADNCSTACSEGAACKIHKQNFLCLEISNVNNREKVFQ